MRLPAGGGGCCRVRRCCGLGKRSQLHLLPTNLAAVLLHPNPLAGVPVCLSHAYRSLPVAGPPTCSPRVVYLQTYDRGRLVSEQVLRVAEKDIRKKQQKKEGKKKGGLGIGGV